MAACHSCDAPISCTPVAMPKRGNCGTSHAVVGWQPSSRLAAMTAHSSGGTGGAGILSTAMPSVPSMPPHHALSDRRAAATTNETAEDVYRAACRHWYSAPLTPTTDQSHARGLPALLNQAITRRPIVGRPNYLTPYHCCICRPTRRFCLGHLYWSAARIGLRTFVYPSTRPCSRHLVAGPCMASSTPTEAASAPHALFAYTGPLGLASTFLDFSHTQRPIMAP